MFGQRRINVQGIAPTSRMSLKISCLNACGNDIKKAEELYGFLSDGIESLPDFDPVMPSNIQKIRQGADDIFEWIASHKTDIADGITMIKGLRGSSPPISAEPIPGI